MKHDQFIICNDVVTQLTEDGHHDLAQQFAKEVVAPIFIREQLTLEQQHESFGEIAILWSIGDVSQQCPGLNPQQAWRVLLYIQKHHDANVGVNWETIDHAADQLYPELCETTSKEA